MKLAVCISGHMRTYKETFESLYENVINVLSSQTSCDVFVYCCSDLDRGSWRNRENIIAKPLTEEDIDSIKKIYNPKIFAIDDLNEKTDSNRTPMLRRIYACDSLRQKYESESNITYDAVLRIRPDTIFTKKITLPNYDINDKNIFFLKYGRHHFGYYDGFALGTPKVMKQYSELLFHANNLRIKRGDQSIKIEAVLKDYIDSLNLNVEYIETPSYILRTFGQKYFFFDQDPITYEYVPGKVHL